MNVEIIVCSIATTTVCAGVRRYNSVFYRNYDCVCRRASRLLRFRGPRLVLAFRVEQRPHPEAADAEPGTEVRGGLMLCTELSYI